MATDTEVNITVRQSELTCTDLSAEIADITIPISKLFEPKQNIDAMAKDLTKQAPVPHEEFTAEKVIKVWQQFELKYLDQK